MKLIIGTKNKGKVLEIAECLAGLDLEVIGAHDLDETLVDPEETGATFEENALQKAQYYHSVFGLPTLADDSGILIAALQNELGIHTRRWGAGAEASDEEWITYFLDRMASETDKRATFVCCLVYIDEYGNEHVFAGENDGVITETVEAPYLPGLPISGCFVPNGFSKVYSAMSVDEKNSISHRGRAVDAFRSYITQNHE